MRAAKHLLLIGTESHIGRGIIQGVHDFSCRHGNWEYHLETEDGARSVRRTRFAIRSWKPDGAIGPILNPAMIRLLTRHRIPAVNVTSTRRTSLPHVMVDNRAAGVMAAEHFLSNGFRRFGYCALSGELFSRERYEGFCERLAASGFACDVFSDESLTRSNFDWGRNCQRMDRWLLSLPKPIAIFCMYEVRGQELILASRRLGFRVPDDIAVVGVGNGEDIARLSNPPLSNVAMDHRRVGHEAARLLNKMLSGAKVESDTCILVPPRQMVIRQSSDIVAMEDADVAAAIRFIRDHAGEPLSVKDLLREIPISRKSMERRFLQIIGRTPKAEIMRVRMERAKAFLCETDLPVPMVARQSGFGGQEIFCTTFRRKLNMTPTDYRRMHRRIVA